jgi:uncharacterized protein YbjT (DUF2867 family)
VAKILVSGATGFVGKRLILHLLEEGHEIYALCRIKGTRVFAADRAHLHYIWGDLRNPKTLQNFPKEIDVAYYLVHSMSEIVSDLIKVEVETAENFIRGLKNTQAKQIIYLGGIINDEKKLSSHLRSRLLVEETLKQSGIPTTILRASIIIGSGSASFEIIRDLSEKLPFMIAPKWVSSRCQPISIRDVIFYLAKVVLNKDCYNKIFDIGGPEVLTFKSLLLEYAKFRHLKRWVINVPVLTPRLSSLWLVLITSVRFSICFYLVESIKKDSIVRLNEILALIPHSCLTYKEALALTFQKIAQNEVVSTWMDAWEIDSTNPKIQNYIQVPTDGCLSDERRYVVKDSKEAALDRIWQIGGDRGYYALNWAWKLRGLVDQMIGGVGLNRGRRHPSEIQVGDSIDFWRVLRADKDRGDLILFATMKVPGEAWLEFKLEQDANHWVLIQCATFRPKGVFGRLYWYSMAPFHFFIFRKMAKTLAGA